MKIAQNSLRRLGALAAVLASVASLQAVTIDLYTGGTNAGGNSPGSNNTRTFTNGSLVTTVTAWSKLNGSSTFTQSFLGQYSGGLGVTNDDEDGSDPSHMVDNVSDFDFVLVSFNTAVDINQIHLGDVSGDSDFRMWIGNTGVLATLSGGTFEDSLGGSSTRTATVNSGNVIGTHLLIGALPTQSDDKFKIKWLDVTIPPPQTPGTPDNGSTLALLGLAMVGVVALRKRS